MLKKPPKSFPGKLGHALGTAVMTGLRILAPLLILGYLYHMASGPAGVLKKPAITLGNLVGLDPSISGSPAVCMVLAALALSTLGGLFFTPPGRFVIGSIDKGLCKLGLYKALRGLVKLPKIGSTPDPTPSKDGRPIWVWQQGTWQVGIVRDETFDKVSGVTMLTVFFPAAPLPTSWNVRRVNSDWTSDAGATAGAWTAWADKGGGALPEDAIEAPSSPPAALLCANKCA